MSEPAVIATPIKRMSVVPETTPAPAPILIRRATQFDTTFLLAMLYEMHAETPLDMAPINPNKTTERIVRAIAQGFVLIAEDADTKQIAGSVAIEESMDWWGDRKFFGDLWYYVKQAHRRTRAAVQLIDELKSALDEHAPGHVLRMGVFYGKDIDRKDKFFIRHGFTKAGCYFVRGM